MDNPELLWSEVNHEWNSSDQAVADKYKNGNFKILLGSSLVIYNPNDDFQDHLPIEIKIVPLSQEILEMIQIDDILLACSAIDHFLENAINLLVVFIMMMMNQVVDPLSTNKWDGLVLKV